MIWDGDICDDDMDPFMHLLLPLLFLLALRVDAKRAVLFAPLAVLPDFDALFGLHRALGHSFIPILVVPLAVVAYAHFRKNEWHAASLVALFYLTSHVVLDLGGVAFLWPIVPDQFFFEPTIAFSASGGVHLDFDIEYGMRPLPEMGTTSFLSEEGAALLLLGVLAAVVYRAEARRALKGLWDLVRSFPRLVRGLI